MKNLILITLLCYFSQSCGKNNQSNAHNRFDSVMTEEASSRPTEHARDIFEVEAILRDAAQRGMLTDYNNTRWFTHNNLYLCKSIVLDPKSFKMIKDY